MEISPFDPSSASDSDFEDFYKVLIAVMALDHPEQPMLTLEECAKQIREPATALGPIKRWAAREEGHIVATATAKFPAHENRHLTIVRVIVTPDRRRQGIGTELLRAMLPDLGADGRTVVMANGVKADASGESWAREMGFVRTHAYVRQVLTLSRVDPALWRCPVPDGFRLEQWAGAAPGILLEEYASARTAILDAPNGDSSLEFENWTAERVRTHEADLHARNVENRVVVAVHEASGRVAGITELELLSNQPSRGFQQDTAVAANFRGHGLGLAIKGAMMRWLTADNSAVADIITHTAYNNTHMIRINHALGYETTAVVAEIEVGLAELTKKLESY
ncbi:GNAT family N-acetyltransferase [Catenulispora yoronensis]|uniref:GNAT family N-acetyltransferase n=1 Tax=Catenulispora yoronensis TaxID=450799 RepID=UPI0031DB0915